MHFCPSDLPLAIIQWDNLSRGFHGGEFQSPPIPFAWYEPAEAQFIIKQYTTDNEDFMGASVPAWELIVRIYDSLTPNGSSWHLGGDFPSVYAAKEYAAYVLWQLRKGNGLAACPDSELIDD